MASSSTTTVNPLMGIVISEKLSKANHAMWKAQILAAVRGSRLVGYLTGANAAPPEQIDGKDASGNDTKVVNPAYDVWFATDQQVLSFVLGSLGREVLAQVAAKETAAELWSAIEAMYSSQNYEQVVNTRLALSTAQKGSQSITEYVGKMRTLGDEMAAACRPIEDEELVEYILTGLDMEYNPVVTSILSRKDYVLVNDAYQQLLAFETHMELMTGGNGSSANMANRGRGNGRGRGGGRGHGSGCGGGSSNTASNNQRQGDGNGAGRGNFGRGNYSNKGGNSSSRPLCQVCLKTGHTANRCWHRFDENYVPEERHVAAAVASYNIDTNWYTDTGATDHITSDLEKLQARDKYNGSDQIHAANGSGMKISHIGHSTIHTPSRDIHLTNVLYVPQATKNLVSVHRLASNNSAYLEFHLDFFLIKD